MRIGEVPGLSVATARLFGIQSAFSYERMLGIGFAHAIEPLLRPLRDRDGGARYREALARHAGFFNAHPYLASFAVGAAARAELDGEPPERIERMRTALCGPLGALGDRLIWAGWLPACSGAALALAALGARGWAVAVFLVLYNAVHVPLRAWGLRAGWVAGTRVAGALASPLLQRGLSVTGPAAALALGAAIPLVVAWVVRWGQPWETVWGRFLSVGLAAAVFAVAATRLRRRLSGLALAMVVLAGAVVVGVAWPMGVLAAGSVWP